MRNEFEIVVTLKLDGGKHKTFTIGDPSLMQPAIRDIAAATDQFLEKLKQQFPGCEVTAISYLPQMMYRG